MVNFLALLGWSPGGDIEIMTLHQMIELFSTDGLQKKPAIFDPKKLEWLNGQHLSLMAAAELEPLVTPALVDAELATAEELGARRDWYLALIDLLKVRARTVHDIVRQAVPYFRDDIVYETDAVAKHWKDPQATAELLAAVRDRLGSTQRWEADALEESLRALAEERGVGGGKVFQPLRVALTGMTVSPGIFEVLVAMGRERARQRLDAAIRYLVGPAAD